MERRPGCRPALALAATLCGLVSATLPACSKPGDETQPSAVAADRTVRFGTATPLVTFDPHLADTGAPFETYLVLVYDGLTRLNTADFSKPYPGLATAWTWLDPTTVEFQLRRDVRFIDGERFDAHAAKANIERMLRLEGPRINTVTSMHTAEAVDDFTFRLHLHFPDPTLLYNLGMSPGMMVSPAAFDNPDLDLDPVGTGPWKYDRAHSAIGEVHRFGPNAEYYDAAFRDAPRLAIRPLVNNRARLNALISGQIDLAEVGPAETAPAQAGGFAISADSSGWLGLTILDRAGELVPELGDPRVRQALGFAVDRQAIADTVFLGYAQPALQPMAPGLGHHPALESFFSHDPDRARALLAEAGVDGFSFSVPVLPQNTALYEAVQAYLRQVNVEMRIKVIEPGTIEALARTREYPMNTIAYPNFDPDSRHQAIWSVTAGFNPFRYEDPRLEWLGRDARRSLDEELRARHYREYFNIVVKQVLSLPLVSFDEIVAYDPDRLTGVRVDRYMLRDVRLRETPPVPPAGA